MTNLLPNLLRPGWIIARYTLLEALRNRLIWLLALAALAGVGLSGFLNELALTESRAIQAALLAALLRLAGVFLIATFVVTSMAREANDKGLDMLLALPMPRAAYLLGKLAGFGALALLPALLFGALLLFFAPPVQGALWAASLLCELWIVAAFSLLCALSLHQAMPALAAVGGFYLLARSTGTLQLLGHDAHAASPSGSPYGAQQAIAAGVDLIAALLPRLDQFTRTDWLIYQGGDLHALLAIAGQSAIYIALLTAAALFDLYRMRTKPLSALPKTLWLLLALALAAQLLWHAAQPPAAARARALPTPPSLATLRLLSAGEPIALSKAMMLYLQGYDDQPGARLALARLDYGAVRDWLARMLELDPRGQYPLLAASQVYAGVADPARVRQMLDFVYRRFQDDPGRRWPWLAHAAIVARHRLHDLPLARQYAQAIRLRATGADVPDWAREMEAFILADMDELDSARLLIGALLRGGQVSDPHELQFLSGRLDEIAARQSENRAGGGPGNGHKSGRENGRETERDKAAHEP